jgi:D-amino-acid dehydrogenase
MSNQERIAVIGGGVIGASCALALAQEGRTVTVFEQGPVGHGCSYGNGAQYNVGSAFPIAYPGVIKQGLRWLFDAQGPVRIAWNQFPKNIPWFLDFYKTSQHDNWVSTYKSLHAINAPCVSLYRKMLGQAEWQRIFRPNGALHVWRNASAGRLEDEVNRLRETLDVPFRAVDAREVHELEPSLSTDYQRGIFFPESGHVVSSLQLVEGLMHRACSLGVALEHAKVHGIASQSSSVTLKTSTGDRSFDAVVVAAGYASKDIAKRLGTSMTLASERGYHIMLPGTQGVNRPVTDAESAVVATPLAEGLRVVGIAEFDAAGVAPDQRQPEKLLLRARRLFPRLDESSVKTWMGIRPSTPDSLPIIDRHPSLQNVIFATGHGHMGISGAPMTAALVTDLIAARSPRIPLDRYRLR